MKKIIFKISILIAFALINSCEPEESGCEFESNCFSDENGGQRCIETPIAGTCVDNDFGF